MGKKIGQKTVLEELKKELGYERMSRDEKLFFLNEFSSMIFRIKAREKKDDI